MKISPGRGSAVDIEKMTIDCGGKVWLWFGGDPLPERAPDLAAAVGRFDLLDDSIG